MNSPPHPTSKLGVDATKKIPGEGFNPDTCVGALIEMDAAARPVHVVSVVKAKVGKLFNP